jgi:xanthine dehydrogenase accessory factor
LLEQGLSETEVDRLRGPIGLNIGAQTPEEIALAIMGEVVAAHRSGN